MTRERAALADDAAHLELRAVPLQNVLDDGEAESRAAGRARAALIDTVEALGQSRDMLGGDADAGVGHGEVTAVLVHPPAHLDGSLRGRVFGRYPPGWKTRNGSPTRRRAVRRRNRSAP